MPIKESIITNYTFSKDQKKQLQSVLSRSLAFDIGSFNERLQATAETGDREYITVEKTTITISTYLLPRHCNVTLIEDALSSFKKNPSNTKLLAALGEYTKNDRVDHIGYWIGRGIIISLLCVVIASFVVFAYYFFFPWAIAHGAMTIAEAVAITGCSKFLMAYIGLASFFTSIACSSLVVLSYKNASLWMGFCRWIGDRVKSTHQELNSLEKLETNLKQLISKCNEKEMTERDKNGKQTLISSCESEVQEKSDSSCPFSINPHTLLNQNTTPVNRNEKVLRPQYRR
jgi:hypothetical protein